MHTETIQVIKELVVVHGVYETPFPCHINKILEDAGSDFMGVVLLQNPEYVVRSLQRSQY